MLSSGRDLDVTLMNSHQRFSSHQTDAGTRQPKSPHGWWRQSQVLPLIEATGERESFFFFRVWPLVVFPAPVVGRIPTTWAALTGFSELEEPEEKEE